MFRAIVVAAIALAGCTKLFGIDEIPFAGGSNTDGGGDGARDSTTFLDSHPANVTLTVQVGPAGVQGGIRSNPGSIVCGLGSPPSMCTATFPWGTQVRLDQDAAVGGLFSVWDGACKGQTPNVVSPIGHCDLTLTKDVTAIASFTTDYTLNLSPTNAVVGLPASLIHIQAGSLASADCAIGEVCSIHSPVNFPPGFLLITAPPDDQCTRFASFVGAGCSQAGGRSCQPNPPPAPERVLWVDYTFTSTGNAGCP